MMSVALDQAVCPFDELLAYEALWGIHGATAKTLVDLFKRSPGLPSRAYALFESERPDELGAVREEVERFFEQLLQGVRVSFSVAIHGTFQFPERILSGHWPLELFYYRGDIDLAARSSVSVVGARDATSEGKKRAARVARLLAQSGYTVVSGLAAGIDTAAMRTAMEHGGRVVGVIGTPISESYPKENSDLQDEVAKCHLLISQVPFYRYSKQPFSTKKFYFPARNVTMAAFSGATVIVEASDTSGTLSQARACMELGRKLFILNSCFERPGLKWPHQFAERGAIRVRDIDDILPHLERPKRTDANQNGEPVDQD